QRGRLKLVAGSPFLDRSFAASRRNATHCIVTMPRSSSAELTIAREQKPQPQLDTHPTAAAATAQETEWDDGWERWLRGHLDNHLATLHAALGQVLAIERKKFADKADKLERTTREFEIRLAKVVGAIDVLRGTQPPPPAKFPTIRVWSEDTIFHE